MSEEDQVPYMASDGRCGKSSFLEGSAKVWCFVGWFCWMVLKRKKVANHRFGGIDWNEKSRWTSDGISTNIERVDEFLDTR